MHKLRLLALGLSSLFALTAQANTYKFQQYSPAMRTPDCSLWGQAIPTDTSVTAYAATDVGFGQSCQSETRTCSNGTLSGSYTAQACHAATSTTTWDPAGPSGAAYLTNSNLTISENSGALAPIRSTASHTSGKWYWEIKATLASQGDVWLGVVPSGSAFNNVWSNIGGAHWRSEGQLYLNNVWSSAAGYSYEYANNMTLMFALDADTGKYWIGRNCTWITGNPSTGTSPHASLPTGVAYKASYVTEGRTGQNTLVANFGGSSFNCTVPTGFSAGF